MPVEAGTVPRSGPPPRPLRSPGRARSGPPAAKRPFRLARVRAGEAARAAGG